ncbi:MAG TPA: hypothetical protein VIV58_18750 [Kofleriaceae bacterium]
MRDVLLKRIKPQVEDFAAELVELFAKRFEAGLAKLPGVLEVALSAAAFQPEPEVIDADPDSRDDNPVPDVPRRANRGLHRRQTRRPKGGGQLQKPAPRAAEGREEGERAPRLVEESAESGGGLSAVVPLSLQATTSGKPRQRAVMRCSKCGKLGARADGCGTSHDPERPLSAIDPTPHRKPTTTEVENAKARISNREAAKALAAMRKPLSTAEIDQEDENDSDERWSSARIAAETTVAENNKLDGALPVPKSSWEF